MTLCAGKQESDTMLKKFQSVPLSATRAAHELWHQGNRINKEIQGENELKETSRNLKEKKTKPIIAGCFYILNRFKGWRFEK